MGKDGNNIATSENIKTSYIAVFVAAAVLYISTCAPGPVWQDSGVIQYRVWHNDIEGELGLAISHPLYYLIGIGVKYVQLGEFGYRINLLTAVTSAVAIANLYLLLRLWLGKSFPAFIGAATLALSHTFWRHATIAETYNLYIALLLAELVVVLRYVQTKRTGLLYALGFLNGLAIANHMLAVIGFACWAVFLLALLLKKEIRLKSLAIIITLWIIGAGPYEYLIVKNLVQTGDLLATLESVLFGTSYQDDVLNVRISLRIIRENICWIALNFPTPNALLFFAGLYAVHKLAPARVFANILLALLILFLVFAFRYTVVDRYAFFIPFYCIVSILIGVGAHYFIGLKKHKALTYLIIVFTLLPIPAYVVAPKVAKKLGITSGRGREIPYRDDHKYFLQPWRTGYRGAEKFADEILSSVETDAIVYADSTTAPPLLYAQEVKSRRGDVKMISSIASSQNAPEFDEQTVAKLLSERAIYVVCPVSGYCPEFILENYDFVKAGIVWRVVERK